MAYKQIAGQYLAGSVFKKAARHRFVPVPKAWVPSLRHLTAPAPKRVMPSITRFPNMHLSGLGAAATPAAPLVADTSGAPAGSQVITAGLAVDMSRGDIWFNGSRIPIIPAVISAVVVKGIMFGGAMAGNAARAAVANRFKKAP